MAEPMPEHGEVPTPDTAGDAPSSNASGAHRTPEELIAKAIAPVKGEFLRPPPVRPYSSGQSDAAPEARGGAPQSGLVKEKKSKRQLKRERQQVSPLSLLSMSLSVYVSLPREMPSSLFKHLEHLLGTLIRFCLVV